MIERFKDIFIVHTGQEPMIADLVSILKPHLYRLDLAPYEDRDWGWTHLVLRPNNEADPVRIMARHPDPCCEATWETEIDAETLVEMFQRSRLVIAIERGSPTANMYEEYSLLPREPFVALASWGSYAHRLILERAGFHYQISPIKPFEPDVVACDLAHVAWLHYTFDHLGRECGRAGVALVIDLARKDRRIRHVLRNSDRLLKRLQANGYDGRAVGRRGPAPALKFLAGRPEDEIRPVVNCWRKVSSLNVSLATAKDPTVAEMVQRVSETLDGFAEAALRHHPELAKDDKV